MVDSSWHSAVAGGCQLRGLGRGRPDRSGQACSDLGLEGSDSHGGGVVGMITVDTMSYRIDYEWESPDPDADVLAIQLWMNGWMIARIPRQLGDLSEVDGFLRMAILHLEKAKATR